MDDQSNIKQKEPIHMDKDEFLGQRGLSAPISDFLVDKLKGNRMLKTESGQSKFKKEADEAADIYHQKRNAAIVEYDQLVEDGQIQPRTSIERIILKANGHPDLASTQASRRMAVKRGYDWKSGNELNDVSKELLHHDDMFRYRMLGRMQSDCEFYLGFGQRNPDKLWTHDEKEQIAAMRMLYYSFETEKCPQWITPDDIDVYEQRMIEDIEIDIETMTHEDVPYNLEFSVYVRNLGKYSEGFDTGDWLDLPASEKEVTSFLEKIDVQEGTDYEEYAIHDDDNYPFYKINEYDHIDILNTLAKQLSTLTPEQKDALVNYADAKDIYQNEDIVKLSTFVDVLPWHCYKHNFIDNSFDLSREEVYGMNKAIQNGLADKLDRLGIEDYFDYAAYGRDDVLSGYVELYDNGYINLQETIDFDMEIEEARQIIEENFMEQQMEELSIDQKPSITAKQIAVNINKAMRYVNDFVSFHYDSSKNICHFLYEEGYCTDVKLTDVLEYKNDFKNFLCIQENESLEECIQRSNQIIKQQTGIINDIEQDITPDVCGFEECPAMKL